VSVLRARKPDKIMAVIKKGAELRVFMNASRVGTLERKPSGRLIFTYHPVWIAHHDTLPISLSLPVREESYSDHRPEAFFDNLLPDNTEVRRRIAATLGAGDSSIFELLRVIGRDCVGALQFVAKDGPVPHREPVSGRLISTKEIEKTLRGLLWHPQGSDSEPFRISLAGAQHKTAFLHLKNQWAIPTTSTPTTHIFKPPIGKLPNGIDLSSSVENESLCLQLAEKLGLAVANARMHTFGQERCLVVERFDRRWSSDGKYLDRLVQEDLCQALAVPSFKKYESHGGPGIISIMRFLDRSDLRDKDRATFMRAQIAYFLLAAIDGHGKNFSIHLTKTGFRLAPLYDILSVFPAMAKNQILRKNVKFAMAVGDSRHYNLGVIQKRHWFETAKKCGFDPRQLQEIIDDLIARADDIQKSAPALLSKFPSNIGQFILSGMAAQVKRLQAD